MGTFNEARTAVAAIATFDANSVRNAGDAIVKAINSADASQSGDASEAMSILQSWMDRASAASSEATAKFQQAGNQASQANAYVRTGQSTLGVAVGKGTAEGTIEMCTNIIAFFNAYQSKSESIVGAIKSKKSASNADAAWGSMEFILLSMVVSERHYSQMAGHAMKLKSAAQSAHASTTRAYPTSTSTSSASPSGGCYVATAVYGSYDCPQVWTLRRFRDEDLAKTACGRVFIKTYYAISPTIVKWFGDAAWFKNLCRGPLDALVNKCRAKGYQDAPYDDCIW